MEAKSKRGRPKKTEKPLITQLNVAGSSQSKSIGMFHISSGASCSNTMNIIKKTFVVHLMVTKEDITNMSMKTLDRHANELTYGVGGATSIDYSYICRSIDTTTSVSASKSESYYPNKYICVTGSNIPISILESVSCQKYNKQDIIKQNVPSMLITYTTNATGQLEWPTSSKYACWNCDMNFNGQPIGLPERESDGKFFCYGNFCWFPCALRYLIDRTPDHPTFWQKSALLNALYNLAIPDTDDIHVIIPAPSKELRKKYGGFLSDDEYTTCINMNINYETYRLPIVPIQVYINNLNVPVYQQSIKLQQNQTQKNIHIAIDPETLKIAKDNVRQLILKRRSGDP